MGKVKKHKIDCPFCGEHAIVVSYSESPANLNKAPKHVKKYLKLMKWKMFKQKTVIHSGCPKCGKPVKAVAKELKEDDKRANEIRYIG